MLGSKQGLVFWLLFALVVSVVAPVATAHETPPPYPQLEDDDTLSTATEIAPRTLHGLDPIKHNDRAPGPEIEPPSGFWTLEQPDEDYYAVDLDAGNSLPVALYHDGEDGDLRFTVYDPSKSEIATAATDGNWQRVGSSLARGDDSIQRGNTTVTARCSGTYYVGVEGDVDGDVPYRLAVDDHFEHNDERASAPVLPTGTYEDLMITTYDTDRYAFHVEEGEELHVDVNFTTHAHWEQGVRTHPVRPSLSAPAAGTDGTALSADSGHYRDVEAPGGESGTATNHDWPYDHPRWQYPSFRVHYGGADVRSNTTVSSTFDRTHRKKLDLVARETGTVYVRIVSDGHWTDPARGAAKWRANSARYALDVSTDAADSPSSDSDEGSAPPTTSESEGSGGDAVRSALERAGEQLESDDLGAVGSQVSGEVLNVHVEGSGVYSMVVDEDLNVVDVRGCGREDATTRVDVDAETVQQIGSTGDPASAVQEAFVNDTLEVSGIGTVNEVKWTVVTGAADVAEFAGLV